MEHKHCNHVRSNDTLLPGDDDNFIPQSPSSSINTTCVYNYSPLSDRKHYEHTSNIPLYSITPPPLTPSSVYDTNTYTDHTVRSGVHCGKAPNVNYIATETADNNMYNIDRGSYICDPRFRTGEEGCAGVLRLGGQHGMQRPVRLNSALSEKASDQTQTLLRHSGSLDRSDTDNPVVHKFRDLLRKVYRESDPVRYTRENSTKYSYDVPLRHFAIRLKVDTEIGLGLGGKGRQRLNKTKNNLCNVADLITNTSKGTKTTPYEELDALLQAKHTVDALTNGRNGRHSSQQQYQPSMPCRGDCPHVTHSPSYSREVRGDDDSKIGINPYLSLLRRQSVNLLESCSQPVTQREISKIKLNINSSDMSRNVNSDKNKQAPILACYDDDYTLNKNNKAQTGDGNNRFPHMFSTGDEGTIASSEAVIEATVLESWNAYLYELIPIARRPERNTTNDIFYSPRHNSALTSEDLQVIQSLFTQAELKSMFKEFILSRCGYCQRSQPLFANGRRKHMTSLRQMGSGSTYTSPSQHGHQTPPSTPTPRQHQQKLRDGVIDMNYHPPTATSPTNDSNVVERVISSSCSAEVENDIHEVRENQREEGVLHDPVDKDKQMTVVTSTDAQSNIPTMPPSDLRRPKTVPITPRNIPLDVNAPIVGVLPGKNIRLRHHTISVAASVYPPPPFQKLRKVSETRHAENRLQSNVLIKTTNSAFYLQPSRGHSKGRAQPSCRTFAQ